MSHNQTLGKTGEHIAALFFEDKDYTVIERNWRCKSGEIDLIVKKGDEWRFVEVKMRSNIKFGYPEEAVTDFKKRHFYSAIEVYLRDRGISDENAHADILAIILNNREFDIHWLEDGI